MPAAWPLSPPLTPSFYGIGYTYSDLIRIWPKEPRRALLNDPLKPKTREVTINLKGRKQGNL